VSLDQEEPVAAPPVALADYVARMRRQRRIYVIVLAVIVVLVVAGVELVLRNGESAHATLRMAKTAVAAPPSAAITASPTVAWHQDEATAIGVPVWEGTVVTYSAHTVTGRNYATGAAVWTYTRTDVSICQVVQEQGMTIAFYDLNGNCDEVSAFSTGTGKRQWFRTLDSNGNPTDGHPTYSVSQYTILMATPHLVQAIDPSGGIDRWVFVQPAGCTTTSAVLGGNGVLIGQHCADGDHLVLREAYTADSDDGKTKTTKWRLDNTSVVPVSADDLVSAFDATSGDLIRYDAADGKVLSTQALDPAVRPSGPVHAVNGASSELIWVGGNAYSVVSTTGAQSWSTPLLGLPTITEPNLIGLTAQAVVEIDQSSGKSLHTYPISSSTGAVGVFRIGTGFVLAGSSTTVYH
jgi:hypothetical protein